MPKLVRQANKKECIKMEIQGDPITSGIILFWAKSFIRDVSINLFNKIAHTKKNQQLNKNLPYLAIWYSGTSVSCLQTAMAIWAPQCRIT